MALFASFFIFQSAESAISLESKVKAAYIYKLLNFVNWNETTNFQKNKSTINICVVGDDPIKEAVQLLKNKTVKGRTITVHQKYSYNKLSDCQIVFVTRSQTGKLEELLLKIDSREKLTISDIQGFAKLGGLVELAVVEDKVKLLINKNKVQESKIQFSSKLMSIARLVGGNGVNVRAQ